MPKLGGSVAWQYVFSSETTLGNRLVFVIRTFLLCSVIGARSEARTPSFPWQHLLVLGVS